MPESLEVLQERLRVARVAVLLRTFGLDVARRMLKGQPNLTEAEVEAYARRVLLISDPEELR